MPRSIVTAPRLPAPPKDKESFIQWAATLTSELAQYHAKAVFEIADQRLIARVVKQVLNDNFGVVPSGYYVDLFAEADRMSDLAAAIFQGTEGQALVLHNR